MKGMNLKKLVVVLTALYLLFSLSTTAEAAIFDPVSAAKSARDQWAAKGEYYGYTATLGRTIQKSKSVSSAVKLENSRKSVKITVVCKSSGKMSYKLDGKTMKYAKIEKSLRKDSSKKDQRKVMLMKSSSVMEKLGFYARLHGMGFEYEEKIGKNEVFAEVSFSGASSTLKAQVLTRRQTNKILLVHYFANGRAMSEAEFYEWLRQYGTRLDPIYSFGE
ncbi:hypothetical protein J5500_02975 [Candidatus Saccharibacteria bacterium]|nr:hypothetical protein [Candidatus Saccharibacteria bacterium]